MRDGCTNKVERDKYKQECRESYFYCKGILILTICLAIVREPTSEEPDKCEEDEVYQDTIPDNSECRYQEEESIDIEYNDHISEVPILFIILGEEVDSCYEYNIEKEEYTITIEEWILGIYLDGEVFRYRISEAYLRESFEDWLFDEYIGDVTQVKSASISVFYYDPIGLLEHRSDRVARSSVISACRTHESIDEQENKRYTDNTSIYPRESASCEEKENWNKG
jgi:hypothetical protein